MLKKNVLMAFCFTLSLAAFADVTLFEKGKTDAVIVVSDSAAPMAKYAAKEMQNFMKKSGGVMIPIANKPGKGNNIFIGESQYTKAAKLDLSGLTSDGFKIVVKGKNLYIFGKDRNKKTPVTSKQNLRDVHIYNKKLDLCAFGETGTLYGVYHFLRKYAKIDWVLPGEIGEEVPKLVRLSVKDMTCQKNPDYSYRVPYYFLFNRDPDSSIWYRRAGFGAPFPADINHSFKFMKRYFKEHPEWFALIDGKRDFNITCLGDGNLCLSNKDLLAQFIKDARAYFDANPDIGIFAVMPNDIFKRICECADCQKQIDRNKPENGKYSNYVWNFVNKIAKEVGKTHPGKMIACCAYETYQLIPDRVKLEPNVAVMITKARSFQFDKNYRYRTKVLPYEWKKVVKNLYVWEYYCWDSQQSHLSGLPLLFTEWTQQDLRDMKGIMAGEFIDGGAGTRRDWKAVNPALNTINYYVTGRLYWDASLNAKDLVAEYCKNCYGPGAADMLKYWRRAEELWTKNNHITKRSASDGIHSKIYTNKVLLELKSYVEAAMKKVAPGSIYAKRIEALQEEFYPHVEKMTSTRSRIPETTIKRAAKKPVIDGKREMLWRRANVIDFVQAFDATAPMAKTYARLLHDDENLYIFVNCFEPRMSAIVTKQKKNHNMGKPYIWEDDSMEIFISPDASKPERTVQLIINAAGVYSDGCYNTKQYPAPYHFDRYDSKLVCKTGKDRNGWTMELSIPKKSLYLDGKAPAEKWRLNIGRNRNYINIDARELERSSWSAVLNKGWNVPARFGNVVLEK